LERGLDTGLGAGADGAGACTGFSWGTGGA
jgi:hypothetical protein